MRFKNSYLKILRVKNIYPRIFWNCSKNIFQVEAVRKLLFVNMDDFSNVSFTKCFLQGGKKIMSKIDASVVYFPTLCRQFFTHKVYTRFMLILTALLTKWRHRWPSINFFSSLLKNFRPFFKYYRKLLHHERAFQSHQRGSVFICGDQKLDL